MPARRTRMKPSHYRRQRAKELALRDFLAGRTDANPFPPGTPESNAYACEMRGLIASDEDMTEMCAAYGTPPPVKRSPGSVHVRPPL